jgi:hypothetical protein
MAIKLNCCVWLSRQTVSLAFHIINRMVLIIEVESVYSVVRTESLYSTNKSRALKVNRWNILLELIGIFKHFEAKL